MDKDSLANVEYSTLTLFDTICGSGVGGYRVPTTSNPIQTTYNFQDAYEIDTFAPIVNYGSLETLKSAYMASLSNCRNEFAPEDMALNAFCNMNDRFGSQRSYLHLETAQRATFSPISLHRDRLCSTSWDISIEDTLARLPQHTDSLFDTPERNKLLIDSWVVPSWARGEEQISSRTLMLSMRSFVYITSSNEPSVRPGMHRLIDLPVFGNVGCSQLPNANCAPRGFYVPINTNSDFLTAYEKKSRTTGRQLMRRVRVSQMVESYTGQTPDRAPFAASGAGCFTGDLVLLSRPVLYSSMQWMSSLKAPPPLPPPPPPNPPPPNPLPPFPNPPPLPPYVEPQGELMSTIRGFEEQACTSVYFLTTTARCERLAVQITSSVLFEPLDPPSPPPGQPFIKSPPPPSSPPLPGLPSGISSTPIAKISLSTIRIPTVSSGRRLDLYSDGFYMTRSELDTARTSLVSVDQGQVAKCTPWQTNAPIPCVSGAMETNCMSGLRRCGTEAENSLEPVLELWFSGSPSTRNNRLWGLEIDLPQNEELANLFFKSADRVGGVGYEMQVFKSDGSSIPCQTQSSQVGASSVTSDRKIQHVCASGGTTDEELHSLMDAERVRVILIGPYRQIWIKSVTVYEISVESSALPPRPPRPPPLPILPPTPPNQPPSTCSFFTRQFLEQKTTVFHEPCGLEFDACCFMAHSHGNSVNAFELDDAGCCTLLYASNPTALVENAFLGFSYLSDRAGTGVVIGV